MVKTKASLGRRKASGTSRRKLPNRRESSRQTISKANQQAKDNLIDNGVLYIEKSVDGHEEQRKKGSLQVKMNVDGPMAFEALPKGKLLNAVNEQRRKSRAGIMPCYDVMDRQGSSIYAYSIPLSLMAGLLQGMKSKEAIKILKKESARLNSHKQTDYMFLHWQGRGQEKSDDKDYRKHYFCTSRPGLVIAIESLGNMIARKILFHPDIGEKKYPGILSNRAVLSTVDQDFQDPHWDFIGWREIKARDMPWVVHVPLCKEGMMLHIWPTQRDQATHADAGREKFKLGTPKLIFVAFGDYLLLRADVCHGGCFGSKGNMRFHMVLRRENCPLDGTSLQLLETCGVDKADYAKKERGLLKLLGLRDTYFRQQQSGKAKTVAAYVTALTKTVYPEHETWVEGLLENLNFG